MFANFDSQQEHARVQLACSHIKNGLDKLEVPELHAAGFRGEQDLVRVLQGFESSFVFPRVGERDSIHTTLVAKVRELPQANGVRAIFANVYIAETSNVCLSELAAGVRRALCQFIEQTPGSYGGIQSIALNCLSSDSILQDLYRELGAFPFCYFPFLSLREAMNIDTSACQLRSAATSGSQLRSDAQALADLAYLYRERRSRLEERSWPKPDQGHKERHANYFATKVLTDENNSAFLLEEDGEVVAAGVGMLRPTGLATPSDLSALYDPDKAFCELDDFFVKEGLSWERYAPPLLSAISSKFASVDEDGILGLYFVQNHLDVESIGFAKNIGARPFREFYLLYPEHLR